MQVVKVFNNNVVLVLSDAGEEVIVMGRGIGFQKKPGSHIDPQQIEKTFVLQGEDAAVTLSNLYREFAPDELDVVLAVVALAEKTLDTRFQAHTYLALADHIHFAATRAREGIVLKNPLSWEVKKFYQTEYAIGRQAVRLIEERLGVILDVDEAASLALHLVNGQKEGHRMEQTMRATQIVHDILAIVRHHFGIQFDEDSVSYSRFVTHVQYFAQRVVNGQQHDSDDAFLYEQVARSYPKAFACAQKIRQHVAQAYQFTMSGDEQLYLAIHIQRSIN